MAKIFDVAIPKQRRSMGKFLLITSVTLSVLATASFAQTGKPNNSPGNSGNNSIILTSIITASNKPQCNSASPTRPCKGNNGFGNGGGDGSPNGKEDVDR